ncbi:hypothetical protein AAC387_Pa07g1973 [Persea americana]
MAIRGAGAAAIRVEEYSHSPAHVAVALGDHTRLSRLLSSLPRLADPSQIKTESDSLFQERLADQISSVLDRRDVPLGETPLHLAVRLNDISAVGSLASAGADISLQNSAGWNALQESICSRRSDISVTLIRHHHRSAWLKWRRRLPRLVAALRRMRDFYMEISFHFESSLVPFVGRIAPSDTYRVWKRDADLRADTSLAGFDGLKIQRVEQSFIFRGEEDPALGLASGSLLVLNRDEKTIIDAFENAGGGPVDEAGLSSQTSVYRPGIDVTRAELVARTNWRRQDKTETVGKWKARVYEIHNVQFSFRTRKAATASAGAASPPAGPSPEECGLVFQDDSDEDFLVAENPNLDFDFDCRRRNSSFNKEKQDFNFGRRNSSFEKGGYIYNNNGKMRERREWMSAGAGRRSVDVDVVSPSLCDEKNKCRKKVATAAVAATSGKESEYVKSLRPVIWLTEQFPLKTEELLPLLDILANKVKAFRRLRELLTTKFPQGTFPVKVAIPVVPTVRVVVTFTKFVDLQPAEQFFTPMSSPRQLQEEHSCAASTRLQSVSHQGLDPFAIPSDYTWTSIDAKNKKMKKSKSKKEK